MEYVCIECGEVFDEPIHWEEKHGLDTPPYEQWSGSPCCHGAYAEARKCDCCDEWITGIYIKTENDQRICENCYRVMEVGDEDY